MISRKLSVALAAVSVMFSASAFAQNKPFTKGFYAGAELGFSQLSDQSGPAQAALVSAVGGTASVSQDRSVLFGRLLGGYSVTENVDLELGYTQSDDATARFSGVTRTAVAYSGNATLDVSGFDYSVLLRPSISTGWNGLFVRLGANNLKINAAVTLTAGAGTGATVSSKSGTGYQVGIGYDARLASGVDVRFSYTRLERIAGESGENADIFSIGIMKKF